MSELTTLFGRNKPDEMSEAEISRAVDGILGTNALPTTPDMPPHQPMDEWIPPAERHRMREARKLAPAGWLTDCTKRLNELQPKVGRPVVLVKAIEDAEQAITHAWELFEASKNPDLPHLPKSPEAKQASVEAIEAARKATDEALELAKSPAVLDAWHAALVADLPAMLDKATESLTGGVDDYAQYRDAVDAAHEVALKAGKFGPNWHLSPDYLRDHPSRIVGELRKALGYLTGDDDALSGRYLTTDYGDKLSPHLVQRLQKGKNDISRTELFHLQNVERGDKSHAAAVAAFEAKDDRLIWRPATSA